MGRLIGADKLLEETRRDRDYAEKNGFMDMYHERQALIDRIEAQPTAYNPDKVVEQLYGLKQYRNEYDSYWDNSMHQLTKFENEAINNVVTKAIEIVRGGGVDG